jgi:hypothetical protein
MESKQVVTDILNEIQRLKAEGTTVVQIVPLQKYFEDIRDKVETSSDTSTPAIQFVLQEQNHVAASNLQSQKERGESEREMFRTVISYGGETIKAAILVNGGAAVAILAFLGSSKGVSLSRGVASFAADSAAYFVYGVLCGAIAVGSTYLTQYCYHREQYGHYGDQGLRSNSAFGRGARIFHAVTAVLVIGAYAVFARGAYLAWVTLRA